MKQSISQIIEEIGYDELIRNVRFYNGKAPRLLSLIDWMWIYVYTDTHLTFDEWASDFELERI